MARTWAKPTDVTETDVIRPLVEQASAAAAVEASPKAKKLRERAEECRVLARIMTSAANMAYYLDLAMTYDRLAEQQEQLARDIVRFGIKGLTAS